jgi:hypothetical protein
MNLFELISEIKDGQIAEVTFADKNWYIVKTKHDFIRYCSIDGKEKYEAVSLTPSNIRADYRIL